MPLCVVYHVACRPDWCHLTLVPAQLRHLASVGLWHVRCTHVGCDLGAVLDAAEAAGVDLDLEYTNGNPDHYEVPAMLTIERLARAGKRGAVLYLHTKGVTQPGSDMHRRWRRLMEVHTVEKWREHLARLEAGYTCCGLDWIWQHPRPQGHFSGNYWLARFDYLRTLPDYGDFHVRNGLTRFSAEQWLGRGPGCRPHSESVVDMHWQDLCRQPIPGE